MIDIPSVVGVDLFCGVGGLTHGLEKAGINIKAGYDLDDSCKFPYESNNHSKFIKSDINELDLEEMRSECLSGDYSLIAGCPPCQPFSSYSQGSRRKRNSEDWKLVGSFGSIVKNIGPDFVILENVPQLVNHPIFSDLLICLEGYSVDWRVVQTADLGIPQNRKRLVLIASKVCEVKIDFECWKFERKVVKDAILGLPRLEAGDSDPFDRIHAAAGLSSKNVERIRHSRPGGSWRDWPSHLLADCHRRASGATYPSVYGRMSWDLPSPTITTQFFGYGSGRFGHPDSDRAISLREAALLQTFPKEYKFLPDDRPVVFKTLGRQIGNAVPVQLAYLMGVVLLRSLRRAVC
ncbi:DNA cytosine methyltransferase [Corynebacterium sp. CCM 9186]|uniref:DNA cytosine methyltransferase n=1 Tax=Corynebacterium meridianum TaxID=2765363 RepID=UPI0020050A48|nr:DNA cytosine methyltransferase [Corynebacterium meridianum]MCK7678267.1 DNA cytosine methyltransferase [Corynebacterium meridianum]